MNDRRQAPHTTRDTPPPPVGTRAAGRLALLPRRGDLRSMRRSPGRDLIAGLTVAVVALPPAPAFGVASGLGAQAGLVTAWDRT